MQRGKFIGKFLARHVSGTYAHYEEHGVYGADCARHHPHRTHDLRSGCQDHLTYLLTPWCRVLLEKLTGLQLVKKFPAFHGTRMFIIAFTSVRHLSLSPGPTQSSPHTHIPKAPTLNKLIRGGLKAPTNYLKFISMEELCKKQKIRMKVRKESCLNFHELMAHSKV